MFLSRGQSLYRYQHFDSCIDEQCLYELHRIQDRIDNHAAECGTNLTQ
jgi:hypothetical protein